MDSEYDDNNIHEDNYNMKADNDYRKNKGDNDKRAMIIIMIIKDKTNNNKKKEC